MKKTIITGIIMLILALFFASCGWDIEIVNPLDLIGIGESSSENSPDQSEKEPEQEKEPESSEEPFESVPAYSESGKKYSARSVLMEDAEEFMSSEEAYEDIEIFVSRVGHLDFDRTQEIVSSDVLFWFGEEIFEEFGEESLDSTGNLMEINAADGNRYIKRYFGVDYVPSADDIGFDFETGKYRVATAGGGGHNRFLSCEREMTGGNGVKLTVLMEGTKDEIGKNWYISEMKFSVMEDDNGKFLRLVSNTVIEKFRQASFEEQAKSLTSQMVGMIGPKGFGEGVFEIDSGWVFDFIVKMQNYVDIKLHFDKSAPYIGLFYCDFEGYHFPVSSMKKIAKEVFGIGNLEITSRDGFVYDSEKREYISDLGWGSVGGAFAKNMETYINGKEYIVRFELFVTENVNGDPEPVSKGEYKMTFELVDGKYLRYSRFDRA